MGGSHNRVKGSAIVREVSRDFEAALSSYFGTSAPDFVAATGSHASYVAALRAHGTEVEVLPELQGYPDCCFIEDTSVVIGDSAIILAPGHPSRIGEVESVTEHLAKTMEIQRLDGGTVDGGDIVFMDDAFLVGRSRRTNSEGIESLSKIIKSHGYNIEVVDVPESTLHLTTICSSPRPEPSFIQRETSVPMTSRCLLRTLLGCPTTKHMLRTHWGIQMTRSSLQQGSQRPEGDCLTQVFPSLPSTWSR